MSLQYVDKIYLCLMGLSHIYIPYNDFSDTIMFFSNKFRLLRLLKILTLTFFIIIDCIFEILKRTKKNQIIYVFR